MNDSGMESVRAALNAFGRSRTPVLFIIDFSGNDPVLCPLAEVDPGEILFDLRGASNIPAENTTGTAGTEPVLFEKHPVPFPVFSTAFEKVREEFITGNSVLLNLTFSTPVSTNLGFHELFFRSSAPYRLWMKDRFVVFSPERFVSIEGTTISTTPMKGTIDADVPDAAAVLLADEKEAAEHTTVVDLLRNDLSMVSSRVRVEQFRYVEEVRTLNSTLLQTSSRISGQLDMGWHERLGDILTTLLPAGSITGAPKKKTVAIIKDIEQHTRGYYTGVAGYYDGSRLDSFVMIRFIEQTDSGLVYKSGGGITVYSNAEQEYREMIDKVYLPVCSCGTKGVWHDAC